MTEETLFAAALEAPTPSDRAALLDRACAGDTAMRRRVEALLASHVQADFLETPAIERAAQALGRSATGGPGDSSPDLSSGADQPGVVLGGRYKLLEQIGEGGMGTVWMARQTEPVKRLVAIKLIKPGMDTKQVLARFEAERQALALMDHPNIARVLEAGEIGGRPFFVMELVKGIPVTQYCQEHRLAPRQLLELFLPVCHAVQHAHQKGIIHRDLKPSNVLVAEYDDEPVAKIIDFGVAKALGSELTEATLFTQFGTVVGTLEYMSPEQAKLNALDIDTRSDVYSLGVLLYELLTGTTPLRRDRLKAAAFDEVLRLIREDEPQKPSTRLSTTRTAAGGGGADPAPRPEVRAPRWYELDWIVMKCLEKDRNRRYDTASGLALDLERYLADEPVEACPPSATYRLRKFVRRHRGPVLAAGVTFLLLIAGIAGTGWGLVRAERARHAEADERAHAEAALVSERAAKEAEAEQRARAAEAARKATREAAVAAAILDFLNKDILKLISPAGQASHGITPDANLRIRTLLQRAAKRIEGKFPSEPEIEMRLRFTIGNALTSVGDHAGALPQFEKAAAFAQELLGRDDPFTLMAEYRLAVMHRNVGHRELALSLLEENRERQKTVLGEGNRQALMAGNGLSIAYHVAGQKEKALQVAHETLELRQCHLGPMDLDTLVSTSNLGWLYLQQKQVEKALPLLEEAIAGLRAKYPPLHPERLMTTQILAQAYHAAEDLDKAIPLQETVTSQYRRAFGAEDRATQSCLDALLAYYVDVGSCDKAETVLKSVQAGDENRPPAARQRQEQREKRHRELIERVKPAAEKYLQELTAKKADHPDTLAARLALAIALRQQNRIVGAAYHAKAVLDSRQRGLGADHPETLASRLDLGSTRLQQQRYADAEPLLLEAYAGLKRHETEAPEAARRAAEAAEQVVRLYDGWGKKDKADEWRQRLDAQKKQ